jgi:hypothetical protein
MEQPEIIIGLCTAIAAIAGAFYKIVLILIDVVKSNAVAMTGLKVSIDNLTQFLHVDKPNQNS